MSEEQNSVVTLDEVKMLREIYRRAGKTVVWTNGCFDLCHAGHVLSLQAAKAMGDVLFVGLNSDASVRLQEKGTDRPLVGEQQRAFILDSLECVDHVILFDKQDCQAELRALQPDIYAKASQYTIDTINQDERRIVEDAGGEICFLPMLAGFSTTDTVEKIRRTDPGKIICAAFAFIRDAAGRLLLVCNDYAEGRKWGRPGGGQNRGERLEDTVVREVKEETGLEVKVTAYRGLIERVNTQVDFHLLAHHFDVEIIGGELAVPEGDQDVIGAEWFDLDRLRVFDEYILGRAVMVRYLENPDALPYYTFLNDDDE